MTLTIKQRFFSKQKGRDRQMRYFRCCNSTLGRPKTKLTEGLAWILK
jgi:hypothetical protein